MRKLDILVSAYACNPAGSVHLHPGEDITGWRLMQQLARFHNLWVITESYNEAYVRTALKEGQLLGVRFYFISLPPCFKWFYHSAPGQRIYYYLWQILAWRVARKLHREFNFDVAHHITFGNYWIPSFIGAFLHAPFIWGPIGGGQRVPWSFYSEYTLRGKISEIRRVVAQWFCRNILFPRKRSLKNAKAILVCNYETKLKIPKKYLEKVYLFPVNGIGENEIKQTSQDYESHRVFQILGAGRLECLKGFALAIRAFSLFAQEFQNCVLEIVGEGPEEARLKALAQTLGIKDKVIFRCWLSREELLSRMRKSDVFLFPSFRDGGASVVVYAMASGKPVICLNIGGPGFHINDKWGIKIEPKDPEYVVQEIAKDLKRLYLDNNLRIQLGESARKRTEDFYLWDRLGEKMQEIYKEVLKI